MFAGREGLGLTESMLLEEGLAKLGRGGPGTVHEARTARGTDPSVRISVRMPGETEVL